MNRCSQPCLSLRRLSPLIQLVYSLTGLGVQQFKTVEEKVFVLAFYGDYEHQSWASIGCVENYRITNDLCKFYICSLYYCA